MTTDNVTLPSEQPKEPQQNAPLVPGTPEYDAAMIAKAEGNKPEVPQRPDNVPEKFWDAEKGQIRTEELLKSYSELERFKKPAEENKPADQQQQQQQAATDEDAAKQALEDKGLSFDEFANEFTEKGELTAESYEKLAKAGIPQEIVDAYIEGQKALASQRDAKGYEIAGGQEAFQAMADWAAQNLPVDERIVLNKQLSGSEAEMKLAITSLKASYEAANGKQPQLLNGAPQSGTTSGYESKAQMTADMRDPRYAKDPAFRAKVEQKLAATTAF